MNTACSKCTKLPYGILQILAFSTLTATITSIIIAYNMSKIWKDNWSKYRCKLHVMPFASFVEPNNLFKKLSFIVKCFFNNSKFCLCIL